MTHFDFNNKKIVILIKVAVLGGAERQALGMADYLIRNYNCNITIVATYSNEQTIEFQNFAIQSGINRIHFFGTPSLTIPTRFSVVNIKKIARAIHYLYKMKKGIAQFKPDIVIPFLNSPSKIATLLFKSVGAKITFWHQLGLDSYLFDYLEKKAIKKAPFFIANSENGLDVFKKHYHVPNEKLYCLPQYVSIKKIDLDKKQLKNEFKINNDAIVIGMIAHYRHEKFHKLLLEAFNSIQKELNIHLVLLGNKDNNEETLEIYNELIEKVADSNNTNSISVLSGIPVEKVLNVLDIGVLVSEIEGTPNVVMEYMLYGLPVVASNHDGCKKLLDNSSFLISNDISILIEKLKLLILDEDIRNKESKLNIERIKKNTIENYFSALTKIINNHI